MVLFIESLDLNVTKFLKEDCFKKREGQEVVNTIQIKRVQRLQHFRFDTGLEYFKYAVLVVGHKP